MRGRSADHVLLSGPPGLGKTTLSMIIAAEMNVPLRISSGPAIQHAGDLAAILSSLSEGEVLFLDEIHRMSRPAEEMLYMAMEDFRVDIVVGKGAGATAIPLDCRPSPWSAPPRRAGLLPGPLRDRFGFTGHLEFYSVEELELVLRRSAGLLDLKVNSAGFARSPAAPAARRASPTGSCAASGTGRWCTASSRSTPGRPPRRWTCTRWTSAAWTGWTVPFCEAPHHQVRRRAGGPVHAGHRRRRGNRDGGNGRRAVSGP